MDRRIEGQDICLMKSVKQIVTGKRNPCLLFCAAVFRFFVCLGFSVPVFPALDPFP